jgi:hypothetical protein
VKKRFQNVPFKCNLYRYSVGEAAALVRQQVHEHLELGEASFWKAEVLHKALVEEQK